MKRRWGCLARLPAIALVAALTAGGSPAAAQPAGDGASEPTEAELNAARERFREGLALEEKKDWAGARRKFERVKETRTTPQVLFHLALCDENTGALVAALAGYERALEAATQAGASAQSVADTAREHLEALRPRVPRVKVEMTGDEEGDEVHIDDRPAPRDALAEGVPVDPGSRRIVVLRGGEVVAEKKVRVAEGEKATVRLAIAARPEEAPDAPPVTRPPPKEEPSGGSKVPALIVGGVGVASLVGAGVTFGLSRAALDEVLLTCSDPDAATGCDPAAQASEDEANTLTTTSIVLGVVGAACVATGVVLWLTLDDGEPATPAAHRAAGRSRPRVGIVPTGLGATALGEF